MKKIIEKKIEAKLTYKLYLDVAIAWLNIYLIKSIRDAWGYSKYGYINGLGLWKQFGKEGGEEMEYKESVGVGIWKKRAWPKRKL